MIERALRIPFQNGSTEPGNEVSLVEMDPTIEAPEPAEAEAEMPAIENMIQGAPPHTPLLGSLYGVLGHHHP